MFDEPLKTSLHYARYMEMAATKPYVYALLTIYLECIEIFDKFQITCNALTFDLVAAICISVAEIFLYVRLVLASLTRPWSKTWV